MVTPRLDTNPLHPTSPTVGTVELCPSLRHTDRRQTGNRTTCPDWPPDPHLKDREAATMTRMIGYSDAMAGCLAGLTDCDRLSVLRTTARCILPTAR